MPELSSEQLNEEANRCVWESFHNFKRVCRDKLQDFYRARGNRPIYKLWQSECGEFFDGLQERCPSCNKRVYLIGFDAWWEARKSYHP